MRSELMKTFERYKRLNNKVILIASLTLGIFSLKAQTESASEVSKVKFGFSAGTTYAMIYSANTPTANYEISNGLGLNLGVLMDYSFTENFIVSPKAELAFNNSKLEFINTDGSRNDYNLLPVSLNVMTHFKYKLSRKVTEPYFFIGPNINIPLQSNPESSTTYESGYNFLIDLGLGLDNTFKHFVFAPELKYSYGLVNINQHPSLKSVYMHNVGLFLNFK